MFGEAVATITNKEQYKMYLNKYQCSSLDELTDTLWYTYAVSVEMPKKLEDEILFSEKYDKENNLITKQ